MYIEVSFGFFFCSWGEDSVTHGRLCPGEGWSCGPWTYATLAPQAKQLSARVISAEYAQRISTLHALQDHALTCFFFTHTNNTLIFFSIQ
jgi:hypothetical protein